MSSQEYLESKNYCHDVKTVIYPNVSHLTGMMPNKEREKKLYWLMPLIGILYKSFGKHKKDCMEALVKSECRNHKLVEWASENPVL